jgi:hypothetical protein
MSDDISSILRNEINDCKKMRHEIVMKKFAAITLLLGISALPENLFGIERTVFTVLLYLVPFVAIAFDIYLFVEDYRIKRAGQFLQYKAKNVSPDEKAWEEFTMLHSNIAADIAFVLVTLIYFLGAIFLLYNAKGIGKIDYFWIVSIILIESMLFIFQVRLNKVLSKDNKKDGSSLIATPDKNSVHVE